MFRNYDSLDLFIACSFLGEVASELFMETLVKTQRYSNTTIKKKELDGYKSDLIKSSLSFYRANTPQGLFQNQPVNLALFPYLDSARLALDDVTSLLEIIYNLENVELNITPEILLDRACLKFCQSVGTDVFNEDVTFSLVSTGSFKIMSN